MAGETRLTAEQKRTILEQSLKPAVETPKPPQALQTLSQLKPVRQEVQKQAEAGVKAQLQNSAKAAAIFSQGTSAILAASRRVESEMNNNDSEMLRIYKIAQGNPEEIFKDCKVQYAYNQRQKIYSVSAMLDNRPRIITVRVGENFTEVSLADQKGNPLEVLRQEDKKGVTFSKTG